MKPAIIFTTIAMLCVCITAGCRSAQPTSTPCEPIDAPDADVSVFREAMRLPWHVVLSDDGLDDWQTQWFLDGEMARVSNDAYGMTFRAGPTAGEDASHAVLWTKDSFRSPIKIEYEYTRLDTSEYGVNILYLLATGDGEPPYVQDIAKWKHLRTVPAMREYVYNMDLYHISYAARTYRDSSGEPTGHDYVRARRYMPQTKTLQNTQVGEDYRGTGLFRQGVPHDIVVIKLGDVLLMHVTNHEQARLFTFDTTQLPAATQGRVGFRHMATRSARYRNIRISQLEP